MILFNLNTCSWKYCPLVKDSSPTTSHMVPTQPPNSANTKARFIRTYRHEDSVAKINVPVKYT